MHWEIQSGRFPRDPRLGHRTGCGYSPVRRTEAVLNDLYTTCDGFVANTSSNPRSAYHSDQELIVILGGSVAMGLGASANENTISAILERRIQTDFGKKYCVINAGCAAYCSWQEFIRFSLEISKLKPKHVISLSSWNDFVHSSIGNRYNGEWVINHDRSIDDLSDKIIGIDEKISFKSSIKQALGQSSLTKSMIRHYLKIKRGTVITDDELRWGYHSADFNFKPGAVDNFIHNMGMIKSIIEHINANFLCIFQPWLSTISGKSRASEDLKRLGMLHKNFFLARDRFYDLLYSQMDNRFMMMPPTIPHEDFVDHCHLNDNGQMIIADYIYENIKSKIS